MKIIGIIPSALWLDKAGRETPHGYLRQADDPVRC